MNVNKPKLTLYVPATYQIKVPGVLDEKWSDWNGGMTMTAEYDEYEWTTMLYANESINDSDSASGAFAIDC